MNGFSFNGLLAVTQIFGFLWVALLFLLCFFAVHAAKLIRVGWAHYKKEPPSTNERSEKAEEKKAPEKREPIYYIVERKRRRAKPAAYSEPKRISFK